MHPRAPAGRWQQARRLFSDYWRKARLRPGATLADWVATDSDDLTAYDEYLDRHSQELESATEFDVETLMADVRNVGELLLAFAAEAENRVSEVRFLPGPQCDVSRHRAVRSKSAKATRLASCR